MWPLSLMPRSWLNVRSLALSRVVKWYRLLPLAAGAWAACVLALAGAIRARAAVAASAPVAAAAAPRRSPVRTEIFRRARRGLVWSVERMIRSLSLGGELSRQCGRAPWSVAHQARHRHRGIRRAVRGKHEGIGCEAPAPGAQSVASSRRA